MSLGTKSIRLASMRNASCRYLTCIERGTLAAASDRPSSTGVTVAAFVNAKKRYL